MTRFSAFALLYMVALLIEVGERWRFPAFTVGLLLLTALILRRGITPSGFFLFLAATTARFVTTRFPDVPNHVNITLYCNFLLMSGLGYALIRKARFPTDDQVYQLIRPILQTSLILVYALAGFHKLNHDFLDPEVSCARIMIGFLAEIPRSGFLGIPVPLLLAIAILPVGYRLLRLSRWQRHQALVATAAVVSLAAIAGILVLAAAPGVSPVIRAGVLAMALLTIVWELAGGLLLTVPRAQAAVLVLSMVMHASFSMISFADFSALAIALLFTFVPREWFDRLNHRVTLPVLRLGVHRLHLYGAVALLTAVAGAWGWLAAGLVFNAAVLILIWPLIVAAVSPPVSPAWTGVPVTGTVTPKWMYAFPALLLFHGLTSYTGLRTTGNFSMFSNLRTEGPRSNHLLLGSNPLKIWGYQEDVIEIIQVDEALARTRITAHVLQGYRLPVVEFRKLIHAWTLVNTPVPMTFRYRGQEHNTPDITRNPLWRVANKDWEMRLLDFRVIQPSGPNECRW